MNTKLTNLFLLFLSLQFLMPSHIVLADTGPKPTMEFTFKQELNGETATINSGILYECEQPDCRDAAPLQQLGPQGFSCDALSCNALAYGFSQYHKLEIQFSDGKTRQSDIFKTAGFDSKYTVTIQPDELLVESHFSAGNMFPRAVTIALICGCFLVVGLLITGVMILLIRRRKKS